MPIYGVGSVKKKKYGLDFLKLIRQYCKEHDLEEQEKSLHNKKKKYTGETFEQVGQAFNDGQSIDHLAEEHGVKQVTIIKHLKTYLKEGNKLRPEGIAAASDLSMRKQDEVLEVMDDVGAHMLRIVYNKLDKAVGYSELRVMQLYYMAQQ